MNIGMCSVTCPKDLNPQDAIQDLIQMIKDHKKSDEIELRSIYSFVS
jgi:succinate dehydrogenase/fumarate reductase-like Fe-S protein